MDTIFSFQQISFFKQAALHQRTEKTYLKNKLISFLQIKFFLSVLLKLLSTFSSLTLTIKLIKVKLHFCRH